MAIKEPLLHTVELSVLMKYTVLMYFLSSGEVSPPDKYLSINGKTLSKRDLSGIRNKSFEQFCLEKNVSMTYYFTQSVNLKMAVMLVPLRRFKNSNPRLNHA